MDFFKKAGSTIATKGKAAADKAKEIAEVAGLNNQISAKEANNKTLFQEIGKIVFYNDLNNTNDEYADKVAQIKENLAAIEELKKQIKETKGIRVCPSCGAEAEGAYEFCPKCGEKMPVVEKAEAAAETTEDFTEARPSSEAFARC